MNPPFPLPTLPANTTLLHTYTSLLVILGYSQSKHFGSQLVAQLSYSSPRNNFPHLCCHTSTSCPTLFRLKITSVSPLLPLIISDAAFPHHHNAMRSFLFSLTYQRPLSLLTTFVRSLSENPDPAQSTSLLKFNIRTSPSLPPMTALFLTPYSHCTCTYLPLFPHETSFCLTSSLPHLHNILTVHPFLLPLNQYSPLRHIILSKPLPMGTLQFPFINLIMTTSFSFAINISDIIYNKS